MHHSSVESGIDTDQEVQSNAKLQFAHVIPDKIQYDSKQKICLVFNKRLPTKGSFRADFRGTKRSVMQVQAFKINPCTLIVDAPVYYPSEKVSVIVRHITHEGCHSLGRLPFEFLSRDGVLARVLQDISGCPVTFMCESLGISPADIKSLDSALALTFRENMPRGFNLIGLHNNNIQEGPSTSLYPTLLHFAAAFGLYHLTTDCLLNCPGAKEASLKRNCNNYSPEEIAREGGFDDLATSVLTFQHNCDGVIYEKMENPEYDVSSDDPGYTEMRRGKYVNIQLWGPEGTNDGYVETDRQGDPEDAGQEVYEDMTKGGEEADEDLYENYQAEEEETEAPEVKPGQEIYTDMSEDNPGDYYADLTEEGGEGAHYTDVSRTGTEEQELYEDLSGNDADLVDTCPQEQPDRYLPHISISNARALYDVPSNLPAAAFPDGRSASVSAPRRPDRKQICKSSVYPEGLPISERPPAPPKRVTPHNQQHTSLQRTASTGSRLSSTSASSGSSAASAGSDGYQADADNCPEEENAFITREELLQSMKKIKSTKKCPPPLPPADYGHSSQTPPVVSPRPTAVSPRLTGSFNHRTKHGRSLTAPVSASDVTLADVTRADVTPSRSSSMKATRPTPTRTTSEQIIRGVASLPSRRDEEKTRCVERPPAPPPTESKGTPPQLRDRPPAPVPRESAVLSFDETRRRSLGIVPTPFTAALAGGACANRRNSDQDTEPAPAPPPRAAARMPPTPTPRNRPPPPTSRR